jgi:hypothetical protein
MTMAQDIPRVLKAFASNQLARLAPQTYVKLTRQTGRGDRNSETPDDIARYFETCVADYFEILGVSAEHQEDFLRDKVILEYGPGDLPGVAMLLVAKGARKVYCVDRFPLVSVGTKSAAVINRLAAVLPDGQKHRFFRCLIDPIAPEQGFATDRVEYLVRPDGLSGMVEEIDLVISRAVLEHVNNLEATFNDMVKAMRPLAFSLHQVDLKSHGLHRVNPLDFLEYPQWLWNIMYSHKGVPNRWRVDRYRDLLAGLPLEVIDLRPTALFNQNDVKSIHARLAAPFHRISLEDLAWQGFWLSCRKKA